MSPRALQTMKLLAMAAAILAAVPTAGQTAPQPLPAPREIANGMVAQARRVEELKLVQQYVFRQRFVVEKLGDGGALDERIESVYETVWVDGARYMRLVERNGVAITGRELEQEQKREREFRKRLAEEQKKKPAQRDVFRFDEEFINRYHAEVLGRETIHGREAFVIRFAPKSEELPARGRFERLLNRVSGKIWVDAADSTVVRAEGRLLAPVKWGWGLMATIHTLTFNVEQTRMEEGVWLPQRLDVYVQGRVVFSALHQRQQSTWSGFRKRNVAQTVGAPTMH